MQGNTREDRGAERSRSSRRDTRASGRARPRSPRRREARPRPRPGRVTSPRRGARVRGARPAPPSSWCGQHAAPGAVTEADRGRHGPRRPVAFGHAHDARGDEPATAARRVRPVRDRPRARGWAGARGRRLGGGAGARLRRHSRRRAVRLGPAGQCLPAGAPHPRPLRAPHRRGGVPPRVARPHATRDRARAARAAVARGAPGRARRPRGALLPPVAGRGRARLPRLDDLRGPAGAARAVRRRRRMGAPVHLDDVRPAPAAGGAEGRGALRHGDDREAGRLRRAHEHHPRPPGRGGPGAEYELTGHKWFCSAPMCDAFLMLAQTERGLSCFLVPRWRPDGTRNTIHLQRPKDKLGNRSNASAEIELDGAWGRMVGEEGRGVATIIEMVNHTRLDCTIGAAALMRQALVQAVHHAIHRVAFGRRLIEQPLMRNVLADLALESEAATATMLRLARAYDDAGERHFARLATAVAKYWVCKRAPAFIAEALECLGGNGYVEESGMPRLYREAPLNGIWEGSGNVICLDVLRALAHGPEPLEAFYAELGLAAGADRRLDAHVARLKEELADRTHLEARARSLVERMALALEAALLVRHAEPAIADAFCASRLGDAQGRAFGTLPPGLDGARILPSAWPAAE